MFISNYNQQRKKQALVQRPKIKWKHLIEGEAKGMENPVKEMQVFSQTSPKASYN